MRLRHSLIFAALLMASAATPLAAQASFFVTTSVGGAFDLNDQDGRTGGGLGFQGGAGVRLRDLSFGGEVVELSYGDDRKARAFGGFVRLHAFDGPRVSPYLVLGIAAYRFTPVTGGTTTTVGGSVGPGAAIRLGSSRLRLVFEGRFHTSFDELRQLSRQEVLSVMAGLQLRL